ncbi:MAG: hypothetical protein QM817_25635 [Archangium sp.]
MRTLACTLVLLSAAAHAEVSTRALIWGGGATPDDAAAALKNFRETPQVSQLLEFSAGYPKIVESKSVAGLKPGFHVVLLGVCGADESVVPLSALKAMQPQVYARPVQITERNCPKLNAQWKAETKVNGQVTSIGLTGPYGSWKILVSLLDANGEIIDFKAVSDADCPRGADLHGWDATSESTTVSYTCMEAGCTAPDETDMDETFTVVKKRLKQKTGRGAYRKGMCD